jgi:hypothetical protein
MAFSMTKKTTDLLISSIQDELQERGFEIPGEVLAEVFNAITRKEVLRIAKNEKESV